MVEDKKWQTPIGGGSEDGEKMCCPAEHYNEDRKNTINTKTYNNHKTRAVVFVTTYECPKGDRKVIRSCFKH